MIKDSLKTDELSDKFKALSHPYRLRIVQGLLTHESNVTHLQHSLGLPQPSISAHLARLRAAGIVEGQRQGQEIYYHIADSETAAILQAVLPKKG